MLRIADKICLPSADSLPIAGKDCSNKSIAIDTLIKAASRLPIFGSGVDMGAAIGGLAGSEIPISFAPVGTSGIPFGVALSR